MTRRAPTAPSPEKQCPVCGHADALDATGCGACGRPYRGALAPEVAVLQAGRAADRVAGGAPGLGAGAGTNRRPRADVLGPPREPRVLGLPAPVGVLAIGAAAALVVSYAPLLGMFSWYVRAFVHEIGHTVVGWLTGHPSLPAISLLGQGVTIHGTHRAGLAWLMAALAVAGAAKLLRDSRRHAAAACAAGAAVLVLAIFSGALRLSICLLAGHAAELAVAAFCLARAVRPCPDSDPEHRTTGQRAALAFTGFLLAGHALVFGFRLATDHGARVAYQGNGSFGCQNDLDRMADVTGLQIAAFGLAMLAAALASIILSTAKELSRSHEAERAP